MVSKHWAGLVLAFLSGAALAQTAPAPAETPTAADPVAVAAPAPGAPLITPGVATLGDLDRIQSEIVMSQARTRLAESRQSLAKAEGSSAADGFGEDIAPVVAGVFGPADRPYAKFLLAGGAQMIGRAGDALSGGYRVVQVGIDKVVIKDRKGRQIVARFSGTAPTTGPDSPPAMTAGPAASMAAGR